MVFNRSGRKGSVSHTRRTVAGESVSLPLSMRKPEPYPYLGNQITSPDLLERAKICFTKLRGVDPSKPPPPLVLALDEAHVMTMRDAGPVSGSLLDIFLKCYG